MKEYPESPSILESKNKTKEVPSPFNDGEIFNPENEFINLKKFHGQEGLDKLEAYKQKLKFQKDGLAKMEFKLYNLIEQKPNFSIAEFDSLIADDIKKYALIEEQKDRLYAIVEQYQKNHKLIEGVKKEFIIADNQIDGRKMYHKFFDREPNGQVKVIVHPMAISFCPEDFDDYAYLTSQDYLEHKDIDEEDRMIARTLGGGKLNKSLIPGFDDLLVIESPNYYSSDDEINYVLAHEEKHTYNRLKADAYNIETDYLLAKINKIESALGQDIPKELLSFMINNSKLEFKVKDEIIAYFKQGYTPKFVSKALLGGNTIYEYGYKYNRGNQDNEDIDWDNFDPKYKELVENGIIAFVNLLKSGRPYRQVQGLLFNEPLENWPRAVERMSGFKKTAQDKIKDRREYISKKV